jgi:uncharacterized protein (DUF1697 family)
MALVVLLRGVNVGGHKTFRPARLAEQLQHLGAVNIGAAGTFVIRKHVSRVQLRAELAKHLPFSTEIMICSGQEILDLVSRNPFVNEPVRPDITHFVSVLATKPRSAPKMPVIFPPAGKWMMRILERENRFVFGVYRREMKAIGYLDRIDRMFGVPATTRNWNTMSTIAKVLGTATDKRS